MVWASALSLRIDPLAALAEAQSSIDRALDCAPDLILLFATGHHLAAFPNFVRRLRSSYPNAHLLGCSAHGVIGAGREAERREALSLMAGVLPGVEVRPIRLEPQDAPDEMWLHSLCGESGDDCNLILLPEPFSCDVEAVLKAIDQQLPRASCIGGLVSGAEGPDESTLLLDDEVYFDGLVGVSLSGKTRIQPIVSQGSRPVGEPMIVTRAQDNIVHELNIGRPTDALQRLYKGLSPREQQLCHTSLVLGVEAKPQNKTFKQHEFLITDVQGMEPNVGAMALGRRVRNYQVVQFHLRDPDIAATSVKERLAQLSPQLVEHARGLLLFSGTGRGEGMFGKPDGDVTVIRGALGPLPIAGFFSAGEIAKIGSTTYVHGTSAALGVLSEHAAD